MRGRARDDALEGIDGWLEMLRYLSRLRRRSGLSLWWLRLVLYLALGFFFRLKLGLGLSGLFHSTICGFGFTAELSRRCSITCQSRCCFSLCCCSPCCFNPFLHCPWNNRLLCQWRSSLHLAFRLPAQLYLVLRKRRTHRRRRPHDQSPHSAPGRCWGKREHLPCGIRADAHMAPPMLLLVVVSIATLLCCCWRWGCLHCWDYCCWCHWCH